MAFLIKKNFLDDKGDLQFKMTQKENITYKIIRIDRKNPHQVKYLTPFYGAKIEEHQSEFGTKTTLKQHERYPVARFIEQGDRLAISSNTFSSFVDINDAISVFKIFKPHDKLYRLYECVIPVNTKYLYGMATLIATIDNIATDLEYKTISSSTLILYKDISETIE